jgi:hypothetical protein
MVANNATQRQAEDYYYAAPGPHQSAAGGTCFLTTPTLTYTQKLRNSLASVAIAPLPLEPLLTTTNTATVTNKTFTSPIINQPTINTGNFDGGLLIDNHVQQTQRIGCSTGGSASFTFTPPDASFGRITCGGYQAFSGYSTWSVDYQKRTNVTLNATISKTYTSTEQFYSMVANAGNVDVTFLNISTTGACTIAYTYGYLW